MLASKRLSFLLQLLVLWLLVFSANGEKPAAKNAVSKTSPTKTQPDKAAGSPYEAGGQQIVIIESQRYQMLARALGRSPLVGEHLAARSEPDALSEWHQKLLEGTVTASQTCELVDGVWKTVMRVDWPATAWDMLTTGTGVRGGGCEVRNRNWVPVIGQSLTRLGTVRNGVNVFNEALTVVAQRGCYSLTTNNCRHFVSALWDKIKEPPLGELKKKTKRQIIQLDEDIEELFIRDFGLDLQGYFSLDDVLFSRMIQQEDFVDNAFGYEARLEDSVDDELGYETRLEDSADNELRYKVRSLLDDEDMEVLLVRDFSQMIQREGIIGNEFGYEARSLLDNEKAVLQPRKVPINTYAAVKSEPEIVRGHVDLGALGKCAGKNSVKTLPLPPKTTTSSSTSAPSSTSPPKSPGPGCSVSTGECSFDCGSAGYDKTACAILAGGGYKSGNCKCNDPCSYIECRLVVSEDRAKKAKKTSQGQKTQPEKKETKNVKKGGK